MHKKNDFGHGFSPFLFRIRKEDSYVIDLADIIDNELLTMIRNSNSKVKENFDLRKPDTVLQNKSLIVLNESGIDLNAILPMLK
jgi:hypothetical protein